MISVLGYGAVNSRCARKASNAGASRAIVRFPAVIFVGWYNEEHRHSGIRYVTAGQRRRGEDSQLLAQ
nr:hypothetical protein [Serratia plymuthica]